jgi:hypothetical protein
MDPDDRPIPERVICDTPEALSAAVAAMGDWDDVVVVERDGRRVAAIISPQDLELFMRLLWDKEMEHDLEAAARAKAEGGESIPLEQLMDELGIQRSA